MNKLVIPLAAILLLAGSAFTFIAAQSWKKRGLKKPDDIGKRERKE